MIAINQKILDRVTLAEELKQGVSQYIPSDAVKKFLAANDETDICLALPKLTSVKARLSDYEGEIGACALAKLPEDMPLEQ